MDPRSPARFTGKRLLHISSLAPSLSSSNPNILSLTPAPNADAASRAAVGGPMLNMVFEAAFDGDLRLFKSLLLILDNGRGRLKETVEALRVKDAGLLEGLGALHVAACRERLEVCKYLIEELQVDVDGVDKGVA
ncbi:26S proteasome non-ATPase regulatory subunit 10 [Hordeum vulgare]|nr:26S proteasome non-ATPase regulatory subunit 10 [Hordeum vulgare]